MYYQILVETNEKIGKSNTNKRIVEIDKDSEDEILQDVIIPYLKNEEFIVNGYFLRKKDIVRLKILTTEKTAREYSEYENAHMAPGLIIYVSPEDILNYDKYTTDITKDLVAKAKEYIANDKSVNFDKKVKVNRNRIFIVHGHDNSAKQEVARFIEKLGFEPIILHEQANEGMTIIEKIEKYSDVGFGIVIYTPCDVGYAQNKESEKANRARQNVVFEHGYLIGKIGRNNVCALIKGNVEKPNDISGVVYITFDGNSGWQIALAKEMKSSGYEVDFNLIM